MSSLEHGRRTRAVWLRLRPSFPGGALFVLVCFGPFTAFQELRRALNLSAPLLVYHTNYYSEMGRGKI